MIKHRRSILHLLLMAVFTSLFIKGCTSKSESLIPAQANYCERLRPTDSIRLAQWLPTILPNSEKETAAYVLEDGGTSLVARAWFTAHAEKSIDIQYFIFSMDNIGLIGCDYLVKAADRGVQVRILIDDIMVDAELEDVLKLDSHDNITIKIYNPGINLGKSIYSKITKLATDFRSANQRMHNKTFIVDDIVTITGGRNIADEYFDYDHEYNFRDRDVLLLGKETQSVSKSFEQFWTSDLSVPAISLSQDSIDKAEVRFDRLHEYACNPENFWESVRLKVEAFPATLKNLQSQNQLIRPDSLIFVSDLPGKNDGTSGLSGGGITTTALIELIEGAKYTIDIQTPYLITTDLGKALFRAAADRGVKVRVLTNSLASTDNVEAFSSYQSDREELLKTGIRIFEFKPDAAIRKQVMSGALQKEIDFAPIFGLHAKSMVIDGKITIIGTFNLDPRSANLNTECIVVMYSDSIAEGVLHGMEEEYKPENAWETTLEFNPDSQVGRLKRAKTWTRKILPKAIL